MSLLNPTVGDVYDRLVVLVLKHRAALEAGKPHEHYEQEYDQLASWLGGRFGADRFPPGSEGVRIFDQLQKVHQRLWDVIERTAELERRERDLSPAEREELSRLCLQAYRLNRGRVRNKEEIDQICGCYAGPEKVTQ